MKHMLYLAKSIQNLIVTKITLAVCFCCVQTVPSLAETAPSIVSQRIVKDPLTGIALAGLDPVSYFLTSKPTLGSAQYETIFAGAIWWFENEGNRAAFLSAPHVYSPQYGGYDATGIARGFLAEGRANIWHTQNNKLFLFHSIANKVAWKENPKNMLEKAQQQWQSLRLELIR